MTRHDRRIIPMDFIFFLRKIRHIISQFSTSVLLSESMSEDSNIPEKLNYTLNFIFKADCCNLRQDFSYWSFRLKKLIDGDTIEKDLAYYDDFHIRLITQNLEIIIFFDTEKKYQKKYILRGAFSQKILICEPDLHNDGTKFHKKLNYYDIRLPHINSSPPEFTKFTVMKTENYQTIVNLFQETISSLLTYEDFYYSFLFDSMVIKNFMEIGFIKSNFRTIFDHLVISIFSAPEEEKAERIDNCLHRLQKIQNMFNLFSQKYRTVGYSQQIREAFLGKMDDEKIAVGQIFRKNLTYEDLYEYYSSLRNNIHSENDLELPIARILFGLLKFAFSIEIFDEKKHSSEEINLFETIVYDQEITSKDCRLYAKISSYATDEEKETFLNFLCASSESI